VYGLQFNTAQGAFLGGYLAAGMTKSGKVATWGGLNIPPVTIYMDGFWEGVQYYNQKNNKSVQVLGWNEKKQKAGTFSQSFTDQNKGKQISSTFIQQGADIIFPVAGGAGLGAGTAAATTGGKVSVIWVDTDGCVSVAAQCKYFLSSVTKNLAGSVEEYLTKAATGTFPTGSYIGTLQNGGTGLAPFHDFDSKVPAALKTQLDQVKAGIEDGSIKITSPSQPAA
jgi:basic membrane protein A